MTSKKCLIAKFLFRAEFFIRVDYLVYHFVTFLYRLVYLSYELSSLPSVFFLHTTKVINTDVFLISFRNIYTFL